MTSIHLTIPGPPRSGERPGRNEGRYYPRQNTRGVQAEVGQLWMVAGRPKFDGAVALRIVALFARPASHLLKGGGLSAYGRRFDFPHAEPEDWDNLGKPLADGLSGLAYTNDRRICDASVGKRWDDGRGPRTEVWVSAMLAVEFAPEDVAA